MTTRSPRSRLASLAAATVLALGLSALAPVAGGADPVDGGDVHGTVTDDVTGLGLAGIEVRLVEVSEVHNTVWLATAITDANGDYDLAAEFPETGVVPYGTYALRFFDPTNDYISEWHEDMPSRTNSTDVVVSPDQVDHDVDAGLLPGGRIRGTVRTTGTGAPIGGIQVRLVTVGVPGSSAVETSPEGEYVFDRLRPGNYQLWFRNLVGFRYTSEWSDEQPTQATADVIPISVGAQLTYDEDLVDTTPPPPPTKGRITGTLRSNQVGHEPLAGIQVRLYKGTTSVATTTDEGGSYAFEGLAPGEYKVWFRPVNGSKAKAEYFHDATTLASSTPIAIDRSWAVADAELVTPPPPPLLGNLGGIVTGPDGTTPLAGVQVRMYPMGSTTSTAVTTGADGRYSFAGRPVGSYQVLFKSTVRTWLNEWNRDQPTQATAEPVMVSVGATTEVDAALTAR